MLVLVFERPVCCCVRSASVCGFVVLVLVFCGHVLARVLVAFGARVVQLQGSISGHVWSKIFCERTKMLTNNARDARKRDARKRTRTRTQPSRKKAQKWGKRMYRAGNQERNRTGKF